MKISEFVNNEELKRDGSFAYLGNTDSSFSATLSFADTLHYVQLANNNENIQVLIVTPELAVEVDSKKGLVISKEPRLLFYRVHESLRSSGKYHFDFKYGQGKNVEIHPTAFVSEKSWIGNNTVLGPNVSILDNVYIGDECFIEAGAVIGGEGILYNKVEGRIKHVKHGGGVRIANGVTILSNASIAKSIFPHMLTTIGEGSMIGVSSIIGHEAVIGKNCVISGNTLVARGVQVSDEAWIGSSSVLREYIKIGFEGKVKAGSIVVKNVKDKQEVSGNFAVEHRHHLKSFFKMEKGLN